MLGPSRRDGATWLPAALVEVSRRAGLPVWVPSDAAGHCCALPWSSKGFPHAQARMGSLLVESLWRWTGEGALPVVIDATSCAHAVTHDLAEALGQDEQARLAALEVMDAVTWAHDRLLPRLTVRRRVGSATVHPTCSGRHLGLTASLEALARSVADDVVVPAGATCCGMAGDRGLLHPELVQAATRDEAAEVTSRSFDAHLSANRTCEVALEHATGRPYESVVQLLERATRP
jgi:D-lactate dehydrogenase